MEHGTDRVVSPSVWDLRIRCVFLHNYLVTSIKKYTWNPILGEAISFAISPFCFLIYFVPNILILQLRFVHYFFDLSVESPPYFLNPSLTTLNEDLRWSIRWSTNLALALRKSFSILPFWSYTTSRLCRTFPNKYLSLPYWFGWFLAPSALIISVTIVLLHRYATGNDSHLLHKLDSFFCTKG